MKIATVSNLFPRPDKPECGMFNAQLFGQLSQIADVDNVCLVPEWKLWKWPKIKRWNDNHSHTMPRRSKQSAKAGPILPYSHTAYAPVFYLPLLGRSISSWTYRKSLRKLRRNMSGYDAVLVPWLYPDGVAVADIAHIAGRPAWIMVLGSDAFHLDVPARKKQILDACEKSAGIICVCKALAGRMIEAGVSAEKVHVVPNGVDGELFKYRSKEEAWREIEVRSQRSEVSHLAASSIKDPASSVALFVGNLVEVKGPDRLLQAWQRLKQEIRDPAVAKAMAGRQKSEVSNEGQDILSRTPTPPYSHTPILLFIGEGNLKPKLERKAQELGVEKSVHFLGSRPHDEIARWMNVADCLCLPSRSEGMPNVVLEALSSGLPVVATDVGACRELLREQKGCSLIEVRGQPPSPEGYGGPWKSEVNGTSDKISEAIGAILDADVDRKAMAERNKGKYSWNQMARTILGLISSH